MKKILCIAFVLLLMLSVLPVSAAPAEPEITLQPQNYHYPEYSTAIYTVKATGTNLSATWYLKYEGKTYNVSDYTNGVEPWEAYAGESYGPKKVDTNTFTCIFGGIEEELNGAEIWCVLEDGHYSVTSEKAIITVQGQHSPPEILSIPAKVEAYRGDSVEIRCVAKSVNNTQLSYTWYETSSGKLMDIKAMMPEESSDFLACSTEMPGTRYYVCAVTASDGGMVYSSVVPVNVLDADPEYGPEMEILTQKLPDAVVGQEYSTELTCNDPYGIFKPYYNPGGANQLEESGQGNVILSYEESYGYMLGSFVRDKDAVTAALALTEMAAWYAGQGMTLYDALQGLYEKYGHYLELTMNLVMPGLDGLKKMAKLMVDLRETPPTVIGGTPVAQWKDYKSGVMVDVATGEKTAMELSDSNVLRYELADGTSVIVRPSGTEPKVKVYIMTNGASQEECKEKIARYSRWAEGLKD